MRIREVVITKLENILNADELANNPNVKDLWILPRGYILFEFYHPALELLNESDPVKLKKTVEDGSAKQKMIEVEKAKKNIFFPLYEKIKSESERLMLLVPTSSVNYFFLGTEKKKLKWPDIKKTVWAGTDWQKERKVEMNIEMSKIKSEQVDGFGNVFEEWKLSGVQNRRIKKAKMLGMENGKMKIRCVFEGGCGDAIMAFYMLLTDSEKITTVDSVDVVPTSV